MPIGSSSDIVEAESLVASSPRALSLSHPRADTERVVHDPMTVGAAGLAELGSLPRGCVLRSGPETRSGRETRSGSLDGWGGRSPGLCYREEWLLLQPPPRQLGAPAGAG